MSDTIDLDTLEGFLFMVFNTSYLALSGVQIACGYKSSKCDRFLHRDMTKARALLFKAYHATPFLHETRVALDWICADTCLLFKETLLFEEIFTRLHIRKIFLQQNEVLLDPHRCHELPGIKKSIVGSLGFVVLLVVMWAPLLLSALATTLKGEANMVTQSTFSLYLTVTSLNGQNEHRLPRRPTRSYATRSDPPRGVEAIVYIYIFPMIAVALEFPAGLAVVLQCVHLVGRLVRIHIPRTQQATRFPFSA